MSPSQASETCASASSATSACVTSLYERRSEGVNCSFGPPLKIHALPTTGFTGYAGAMRVVARQPTWCGDCDSRYWRRFGYVCALRAAQRPHRARIPFGDSDRAHRPGHPAHRDNSQTCGTCDHTTIRSGDRSGDRSGYRSGDHDRGRVHCLAPTTLPASLSPLAMPKASRKEFQL